MVNHFESLHVQRFNVKLAERACQKYMGPGQTPPAVRFYEVEYHSMRSDIV